MAVCQGKRPHAQKCQRPLVECDKCGNVGCASEGAANRCTNQAFEGGKCISCRGTKKSNV